MKPGNTTPQAIIALARGVRDLQLHAEQQYRPVVDEILRTGSRDAQHIERTLDGLLDFCGHEPVLAMYKELCRHYLDQVDSALKGGIEAFIRREVLPYTPDAWVNSSATKIGYEISFTRHFYKPQPLRMLAEISADILAIEKEAEGLLDGLLVAKAEA